MDLRDGIIGELNVLDAVLAGEPVAPRDLLCTLRFLGNEEPSVVLAVAKDRAALLRPVESAPLLAACELCVVALRDNLQYDDPEEGSLERTAHDAAVAAIADAQPLARTAEGDMGQTLGHLNDEEN